MPALTYSVNLDGKAFTQGLASIRDQMAGLNDRIGKLFNFGGILAGLGAVGVAFTGVKKAIDAAAEMEGFQTSFEVLLGSADAAQKRMAELAKFAADTPFELPEVTEASRALETLTNGALSTGQGLTLVGDVASATQQPFADLAVWIGRLYDGLMNGRPVGEAIMRLGELGVISGSARTALEKMQESGLKGAGVWAVAAQALGKFTGMMQKQSLTWNGLMSTLQDNVNALFREFGTPLIDALKPMLTSAIAMSDKLAARAREYGERVAGVITAMRGVWAQGNFGEAAGLSLQIAFGKAANFLASAVKGVLSGVGSFFASLLDDLTTRLADKGMWSGLLSMFEGIGNLLSAAITRGIVGSLEGVKILGRDILPPDTANRMKDDAEDSENWGKFQLKSGAHQVAVSAGGKSFLDAWNEGLKNLRVTLDKQKDSIFPQKDLDALEARLKSIYADGAKVFALHKQTAPTFNLQANGNLGNEVTGLSSLGASSKREDTADRLAKIGLFIGAGGPSSRASESTARNTLAMVGEIRALRGDLALDRTKVRSAATTF